MQGQCDPGSWFCFLIFLFLSFSERDVYLLDDPFSAVDPDIADTLYQNLIQNSLIGKTVIFVTHTAKVAVFSYRFF